MPDICERITEFNKNRLPDMVPLKYKAMSVSSFSFYRGTCHLFYEDLAAAAPLPVSPLTWICGDLHMENFGSYKGDNHVVFFDLNDFDECALAPAAWELARMVTSIFVAFDSLKIPHDEALQMARMFLKSYATVLGSGHAVNIDPRTADGIVCSFLTTAQKRKQKELLKKCSVIKKGERRLMPDARHFVIDKPIKKALKQHIGQWIATGDNWLKDYEVLDCIFRLAGTGSIGVKRYLFLLKSREEKDKFLLLDMKQALTSSLRPYLQASQPEFSTDAHRVITIQKRMQNVSPALLGATLFEDTPYVLQQLQPNEDKINLELIEDQDRAIYNVIHDMAVLTASAQLRSSGRQGSAIADELIDFGQNKEWQQQVIEYASNYAKQVKRDYRVFFSGLKKGDYGKIPEH